MVQQQNSQAFMDKLIKTKEILHKDIPKNNNVYEAALHKVIEQRKDPKEVQKYLTIDDICVIHLPLIPKEERLSILPLKLIVLWEDKGMK